MVLKSNSNVYFKRIGNKTVFGLLIIDKSESFASPCQTTGYCCPYIHNTSVKLQSITDGVGSTRSPAEGYDRM